MKAKVLDLGMEIGNSPAVVGLDYGLNKLIIRYSPDVQSDDVNIVFEHPRGFQCLDEGDLLNYWKDELLAKNWLFEIFEGGWLDLQESSGGFISKAMEYREFLICGFDDCVSVISNNPPIVVAT